MSKTTDTSKTIVQETLEIVGLISDADKAFKALTEHPAYNRVMEFGAMLEAFANGQPKPVAPTVATRKRRSKAEIEADKAAAKGTV